MNRLAVLTLLLAAATLAGAQLYKYVDKDGKTVYTDSPPLTADSKPLRVQSGPSAPPKSAAERDKAAQKQRDADKDKGKKAEDVAKEAERKAAQCEAARVALRTLTDGGRIYKYNKQGEREMMGDEEIESERRKAQRDVEEACKS